MTRHTVESLARRTARFEEEPGYYAPAGLWLYGNVRLLHTNLATIQICVGPANHLPVVLEAIERQAECLILSARTLVCGVHSPAHQRAAIVPLRWGSPRIVVFSGGFRYHLGTQLIDEPFRAARLWRYQWDAATDLAVSRRAPDKLPTYALNNPSVDRLIALLAAGTHPGLDSPLDSLTPPLR